MNKEQKENLKELLLMFISPFAVIFFCIILLRWVIFLAKIFIEPLL